MPFLQKNLNEPRRICRRDKVIKKAKGKLLLCKQPMVMELDAKLKHWNVKKGRDIVRSWWDYYIS